MFAPSRFVPILLFLTLTIGGHAVLAAPSDAVVGNGDPASCTESALDAALANAGSITFNCGPNPRTITLTSEKPISVDTQIDGSGLITLQAQTSRHFFVNSGVRLKLLNITLRDGVANGDGGSIQNWGTVEIDSSTVRDNATSLSFSGGAIVNYGTLTVTNSLLEGNSGGSGGAVYPRWSGSRTYILNSVLRDNHALSDANGWGGALLTWDGAVVVIEGSQLIGNTAIDGGAVYNTTNSNLTLKDVTLTGNQASSEGGGIFNYETLRIERSTIDNNSSALAGGGLFNLGGSVEILSSRLTGNQTTDGDGFGGNIANQELFIGVSNYRYGVVSLTDSTVAGGNAPFAGGGIHTSSALTITRSSLISNTTSGRGGGMYLALGLPGAGTALIQDSTIAGNQAADHGGGLYKESGPLAISFSTIAGNSAQQGGGNVYMDIGQTHATQLRGTILAEGDCVQNAVSSQGDNLDSGASCGLDASKDLINTDPLLGPLAENGGPTQTRLLLPGSPAGDAVQSNACPAFGSARLHASRRLGLRHRRGRACRIGSVVRRSLPC